MKTCGEMGLKFKPLNSTKNTETDNVILRGNNSLKMYLNGM